MDENLVSSGSITDEVNSENHNVGLPSRLYTLSKVYLHRPSEGLGLKEKTDHLITYITDDKNRLLNTKKTPSMEKLGACLVTRDSIDSPELFDVGTFVWLYLSKTDIGYRLPRNEEGKYVSGSRGWTDEYCGYKAFMVESVDDLTN